MSHHRIYSFFHNRGIISKFLLIFALTIGIPTFGTTEAFYFKQQEFIRGDIQDSVSELTDNINYNMDNWYSKMNGVTSLLYSNNLISIIENNERDIFQNEYVRLQNNIEFDKFFEYLLNQNTDIQNIYLFTPKNIYYESQTGRLKASYSPVSEKWYQQAIQSREKITFFSPHESWPLSSKGDAVFSMAREIHNINNQFLGVLLIDVKVQSVNRLVQGFTNRYATDFMIFDEEGSLLYQGDQYKVSSEEQKYLQSIANLQEQNMYRTISNRPVLISCGKKPSMKFRVVGITNAKKIDQGMASLNHIILIIFLVTVLAYFLFILLLYFSIIQPICRLNNNMKLASRGNLRVRAAPQSNDEIGQLYNSFNHMIHEINRLIDSEYKMALLQKNAEFSALQAQINPHFLNNTLQLISSIAVVENVPQISEVAKSLGYMLRFSIKSEGNLVPIIQEIKHMESYIFIQKIRMENRIHTEVDIGPNLEGCGIMKLTLQPFVENAFQHGLSNQCKHGAVIVRIHKKDGKIHIEISDNGCGMCPERLALLKTSLREKTVFGGEKSIGIQNVNARLRLFYGTEYQLSIHSRIDQGTNIVLELPAKAL